MSTQTHGLSEKIAEVRAAATGQLGSLDSPEAVQAWERAWLGPKGEITQMLRSLGSLPKEERPDAGRETQGLRQELEASFAPVRERVEREALDQRLASEAVDVSLPGIDPQVGAIHPISRMIEELIEIFSQMGFQAVFGPEVETTRYNFDLLNIPADHPARDVWDTVIVDDPTGNIVLRTHTSPMQARTMERKDPPVRVIVPGAAYRYEAQDASHEWQLTQLEGLAVDRNITLSDLKGVLQEMARQLFGPDRKVRFRCDFFPFVEPGVDFAVDCAICDGKGCRVCKHTGWLEMGGAGMVHPQVLRGVGYDPEVYTGFAFGLGIERLVMMKYGVDDIRVFNSNDMRFLKKFAAAAV
jgi:phenylalanyl-tRNA synthetase alpha chain